MSLKSTARKWNTLTKFKNACDWPPCQILSSREQHQEAKAWTWLQIIWHTPGLHRTGWSEWNSGFRYTSQRSCTTVILRFKEKESKEPGYLQFICRVGDFCQVLSLQHQPEVPGKCHVPAQHMGERFCCLPHGLLHQSYGAAQAGFSRVQLIQMS